MTQSDHYLLGRGEAEEARLKRQIADLAPDSDAQLEKIGIKPGDRVVDLGCGPGGVLHLLGKRVGPTGSVLGIERSPHFAGLARRFVADHALAQVEVREGDAYETGLPRASFDGAHMRLVLVNVPEPERIVREMVSLVRQVHSCLIPAILTLQRLLRQSLLPMVSHPLRARGSASPPRR